MSWKASAWAKDQRLGSPSAKSILMCLADYADPEGLIRGWASQSDLAEAAEVSERTAREWLQRLEDWGLVERQRHQRPSGARAADHIVLRLDRSVTDGSERCRRLKDGEQTVVLPANSAGRTYQQLDAEPTGNEAHPTGNQFRAYKDKPPIEPPLPSQQERAEAREREGGREDENPKGVERWLKRVHPSWPTFVADSGKTAFTAAMALSAGEREAAADRMADYLKAEKANGGRCAFGVYLTEKRWERLPPKAAEPDKPAYAPAFGPVWAAIRMREFVTGQKAFPTLKPWELRAIENGTLDRDSAERSARQNGGWPAVNAMHAKAGERGLGLHGHGAEEERLGKLCEFVPVDTDCWRAWRAYHDKQGWPWLPDPGTMRGAYFPAGGPERLGEFEAAIRGNQDDVGGREAAE